MRRAAASAPMRRSRRATSRSSTETPGATGTRCLPGEISACPKLSADDQLPLRPRCPAARPTALNDASSPRPVRLKRNLPRVSGSGAGTTNKLMAIGRPACGSARPHRRSRAHLRVGERLHLSSTTTPHGPAAGRRRGSCSRSPTSSHDGHRRRVARAQGHGPRAGGPRAEDRARHMKRPLTSKR